MVDGREGQEAPFCAFALNRTAEEVQAKVASATSSSRFALRARRPPSFVFDAMSSGEDAQTTGQTPFDFRSFIEWAFPKESDGKVLILLIEEADDVALESSSAKGSEASSGDEGDSPQGQLQLQSTQHLVRSLNSTPISGTCRTLLFTHMSTCTVLIVIFLKRDMTTLYSGSSMCRERPR